MYLKGQKLEVALHSLHREYKNVQKSVPRHSICPLQLETYTLIINDLYLQILHSASESRFCVGK